jgi:hypothetical protein
MGELKELREAEAYLESKIKIGRTCVFYPRKAELLLIAVRSYIANKYPNPSESSASNEPRTIKTLNQMRVECGLAPISSPGADDLLVKHQNNSIE